VVQSCQERHTPAAEGDTQTDEDCTVAAVAGIAVVAAVATGTAVDIGRVVSGPWLAAVAEEHSSDPPAVPLWYCFVHC